MGGLSMEHKETVGYVDQKESGLKHSYVSNELTNTRSPVRRLRRNFVPAKSIEGWIIIVKGLHEEAREEDVHELFAEFGEVNNLHLNLDRFKGFIKGYALVEYDSRKNAERALNEIDGKTFLGKEVRVDWAFAEGPIVTE